MSEKSVTNALKIDQKILDKFWTLSEASASTSIKATDQLVELLFQKQKHHNEESTEELEYSIKRLVKGLASSRETARQGFSVALCQILRKFSTVTVEEVLGLVSKHLKLPKKESKSETGYSYLGESLAYLALIQSGRLLQEDKHFVRKVTKSLLNISKKRSYLQQICTNAVCLIVQQVNSEDFEQYVWPEVESRLQCGWDKCSPDILCLLLTCRKHQSDVVSKQFLKEHWDTKKLLKEDNFLKLWNVLLEAASCYPLIHNVNKLVVQELVQNECSLGQFWQTGQVLVFGTSNMRVLNIGFRMLLELLPLVKSADEIKLILTSETVKIWVKNIDGNLRDVNPLLAVTKSVGTELIKVFKSCDNPELQISILKCIVTTEIKPKNETMKTLDLLIQQLSADAAKDYGKYLMDSLIKQSSLEDGKLLGMLTTSDMVIQLRNLVTLSSTATDHDWQLELLQFLVLHAYWNVTGKSKITHCSKKCEGISDKLRKQLQDNFHKAITQLLVFKTESSKSSSLHAYKDTMFQLFSYIQELHEEKTAVIVVKELSDQAKKDLKKAVKCLNEIHSKVDSDSSTLNQSFELLFQYTAIQLFTEEEQDNSILEDLIACHKKATESKRKSVGKKTEPAWIEVLTELLLSMMSQGSLYSRVVAKNVFAGLTNHITPESMSLITEVLRVEKPAEEGDADVDNEDDEEDIEEEQESDSDNKNDKDVDMENEESDSDTDSSESEGEIDDEFRTAIKAALGHAAVKEGKGDEEEEDDDDLSDSEMFKLDVALSQIFQSMKKNKEKEKREKQKQLIIFKLRVLDMVDALVKIQPPADLVLDLLFPLLELMGHGQKEIRELSNRAVHIFKILYKKAKVHSNTTIGTDRYLEALKCTIEFSKKVQDRSLLIHVSDACFLVIRLLLHMEITDLGPSPVRTRSKKGQENKLSKVEQEEERLHKEAVGILASSLKLFLEKRDSKLNPAFFINIFHKAPIICWPLTKTLMDVLKDKDSKVYFKTQACSMMAIMLNKKTHENLEPDDWEEFSTDLIQALENIIRQTSQEEVKNKLMTEMLFVFSKLIPLCDNMKLAEDVMEILNSQKQKFSTDGRRLYNTVTGRLQAHKSGQVNKQKRKSDTDTDNLSTGKKKK